MTDRPFSSGELQQLEAPLSREHVKTRGEGKRTLSFVEGWHVINEANRIFGFDHWTRETSFECVVERERKIGVTQNFAGYDGWGVTYTCKVRVTIHGVVREGCGAGHGIDRDVGLAHESALKEAETDAMKRALMTFGNQFGLALYDKEQANVTDDEPPPQDEPPPHDDDEIDAAAREEYIRGCRQHIEDHGHDWPKLAAWWQSDQQKEAHRKYLSEGEMEMLKALLLSKKPPKEASHGSS